MQKTVVLVKPDALQRGLTGDIISRFERKGLKLVGIKMMTFTDEILDQWYAQYKDHDFFDDIMSCDDLNKLRNEYNNFMQSDATSFVEYEECGLLDNTLMRFISYYIRNKIIGRVSND